jgi:hypothetical protein
MYILGGFDGQRLNDMHHVALPVSLNNDDKSMGIARRQSRRPFSSTSGFLNSVSSEINPTDGMSSNDSESARGDKDEAFTAA